MEINFFSRRVNPLVTPFSTRRGMNDGVTQSMFGVVIMENEVVEI